jgi:hypothetical protein
MVQCEVAKRTLKLFSWVPSLLQVCSSLKGVGLTAESGLNGIGAMVGADRARCAEPTTVPDMLECSKAATSRRRLG